jgi:N-hydroxyarylamine O-acetyltransferase
MNVGAYLSRIGCAGAVCPTLATLRAVHRAHATSIPFENLDIQRGLPIDLDIAALEEKLVARRRGGYCFEHNSLALHALRDLGFDAVACEARVRLGATRVAPRTHMVLLVTIERTAWLWDTGFGGDTLLEPVQLDGTVADQGGASYRVVAEGPLRVVQMNAGNGWTDQYAFVPEPREPVDFEVGNWYTSTHPESHFVTTLTAQQRTPAGSKVLRNLLYTVTSGLESQPREIGRDRLLPLLREEFALDLPDGTRFKAID